MDLLKYQAEQMALEAGGKVERWRTENGRVIVLLTDGRKLYAPIHGDPKPPPADKPKPPPPPRKNTGRGRDKGVKVNDAFENKGVKINPDEAAG
jgi:hypothetical protein